MPDWWPPSSHSVLALLCDSGQDIESLNFVAVLPALGRLREEDGEFKTSLEYAARRCLKKKIINFIKQKSVFQGREEWGGRNLFQTALAGWTLRARRREEG